MREREREIASKREGELEQALREREPNFKNEIF